MDKERNTIEFVKDISEKELSDLPDGFNGEIIVKGNVNISCDFSLPCSLSVSGEIECETLTVNGNLKVEGSIDFGDIHVTQDFYFKGNGYPDADGFGGDIIVDGDCNIEGEMAFDSLTVAENLEFKETKLVNGKSEICQKINGKSVTISRIAI